MKKIERKYLNWGLTAFIVICLSACFVFTLFNSERVVLLFNKFIKIITPIMDGVILAYLLTPVLNFIERNWISALFRRLKMKDTPKNKRRMRAVSVLITLVIVFLLGGIFLSIVIPQVIISVQSIIFQFPMYINNLYNWTTNILAKNPNLTELYNRVFTYYSQTITDYLQKDILPRINDILKTLSLGVIGVVQRLWNFIIGFIISIYVLASKETFCRQAKELTYAIFGKRRSGKIIRATRFMHATFIGFLGGKIVDSIIIGIICFISTSIIGTPYAVLISCIVGVTNVIPFFGPYIGAIPSALLVLMVDPKEALYFVILILIIQQVDGNIIGPKILGQSTGLSSFWVIFSITLFGGLFGIPGMILGVPVFAVIYAAVRYYTRQKLKKMDLEETGITDISESTEDSEMMKASEATETSEMTESGENMESEGTAEPENSTENKEKTEENNEISDSEGE